MPSLFIYTPTHQKVTPMSTPDTDHDENLEHGEVDQEQEQQSQQENDVVDQQEQQAPSVLQRASESASAAPQGSDDDEPEDLPMPDELTMLKKRADFMGIKYSNNIGVETLRARIVEHMEGRATEVESSAATPLLISKEDDKQKPRMSLRTFLQRDNMKLIRIRVTNLDPKKKDLPGEILTMANEYIGTVRKYVPYGEHTENGYHVPNAIFKMMKRRKFQSIRSVKIPGAIGGNNFRTEQSWVPEFAIEVLPPLTREEIAKLAANQHASGATG